MDTQSTTPAVTPGIQTTEYKLANRGSWLGIGLMVAGALVEVSYDLIEFLTPLAQQMPNAKWIGVILLIAGAITKIATMVGYQRARAQVKAAAIAAGKTTLVLLALLLVRPALAQAPDPTAANSDPATVIADAVANSAPDRKLGGCSRSGFLCAGPSATLSLVAWDVKAARWVTGFQPSVAYGIELWATEWYRVGFALGAGVAMQDGAMRSGTVSGVLSFAEYLRVGAALEVIGSTDTSPAGHRPFLLFGLGSDFGK